MLHLFLGHHRRQPRAQAAAGACAKGSDALHGGWGGHFYGGGRGGAGRALSADESAVPEGEGGVNEGGQQREE